MTENEYQQRIVQLEREVADLKAKLTAKQKATRYGLVWEDVPEAFEQEAENKIPILEEVKDKAIKNDDGKPTHILIEGDNYHALQCLNYTHRGKVDVIYIDPPYNTGSDGFTYKDKRFLKEFPDGTSVPKDHPLRHSYWLSFMSKRLELAKNLLSEKGVIFISIDDNEQANLKLLCDKVFGEENFIAEMIWQQGKKSSGNLIGINHEYMLVYALNRFVVDNSENAWKQKKQGLDKIYSTYDQLRKKYKNDYKVIEIEIKKWFSSLPENEPAYSHKHYCNVDEQGLFFASDASAPDKPETRSHRPLIHPITKKATAVPKNGWRYTDETLDKLVADNLIFFGEDENKVPCRKRYLKEFETELPTSVFYRDGRGASTFLDALFKKKIFDNPKDLGEITRILGFNKSSIILDFFAGSGTTLHATMKLNAEDGGKRQCILVQQKEGDKNICESVTYERNKRVMQGYTNAKGEKVEGLGNSLKYYRTAFVGNHYAATATDEDKVALAHKAGCLIAIAENTLEEIEANNAYQIFQDGTRYTAVYFSGNLGDMPEFTEKLESLRDSSRLIKIEAYIYCLGNVQQFENEFVSLRRITLHAIPQPIIEIYKQLNA